jgi:hypothetical protein
MLKENSCGKSRRSFILSLSGLLAGTPFLLSSSLMGDEKKVQLKGALTPEEIEWVKGSAMAKDLDNFFGKGYSCAESALVVTLRFLKKPEELLWAAAGFGGGMGQRDLCGFLTGSIMGIGFAAGNLKLERKEAKKLCSKSTKTFWNWWKTTAPLHCSQIIEQGFKKGGCVRLGKLAAAKLEEILKTWPT